jgi:uncharacterized protein
MQALLRSTCQLWRRIVGLADPLQEDRIIPLGNTAAPALHRSHPEIIRRLRRAEGHLRTIIDMIEAGRGCLDLAQQLHAVEKAVANAKRALIHDHIDNCLEQAAGPLPREARGPIDEFKEITKYL